MGDLCACWRPPWAFSQVRTGAVDCCTTLHVRCVPSPSSLQAMCCGFTLHLLTATLLRTTGAGSFGGLVCLSAATVSLLTGAYRCSGLLHNSPCALLVLPTLLASYVLWFHTALFDTNIVMHHCTGAGSFGGLVCLSVGLLTGAYRCSGLLHNSPCALRALPILLASYMLWCAALLHCTF